ncbi:hypothetical protein BH11PSE7_BH11PSE7_06090 [soil metagenome]
MNPLGKTGVRSLAGGSAVGKAGHVASGEEAGFDASFTHFALHPPRTPRLAGRRLDMLTVPDVGRDDEGVQASIALESAAMPQAFASQHAALAIRSAVSRAADDIRFVLNQLKNPQG